MDEQLGAPEIEPLIDEQKGSHNPRNALALVLLLAAISVPILTAIFNPPVESWTRTGPDGKTSIAEGSWIITGDEFVPTSGDFAWRYFQWGVLGGARTPDTRYFFRRFMSFEDGNAAARVTNIFNPTPFLITIALLVVALFFRRSALKEEMPENQAASPPTTLGLNR